MYKILDWKISLEHLKRRRIISVMILETDWIQLTHCKVQEREFESTIMKTCKNSISLLPMTIWV